MLSKVFQLLVLRNISRKVKTRFFKQSVGVGREMHNIGGVLGSV